MATKEVRFDVYCPKCKHYEKDASEDPCWECLNRGFNYNSQKPIMFDAEEEMVSGAKESKQ